MKDIFTRLSVFRIENRTKFRRITLIIVLVVCSLIMNIYQSQHEVIRIEDSNAGNEVTADDSAQDVEASEISETSSVGFVDISGEVNKPGVYEIHSKTRLYELVELAGGITENADIDRINQAEIVADGSKIIIPAIGESGDEMAVANLNNSGLININTADTEELKSLRGVGDAIAQRIIDYRESNRFESIEDIKNVRGIGDATFEGIKNDICV